MISLTATQLQRFMACNGSYYLFSLEPFNPDRTVTEEGNASHWMIEQIFQKSHTLESIVGVKTPNNMFITSDMVEHALTYLNDLANLETYLEIDTSHRGSNWEVRGRADAISISDDTMVVSDYKYGWGIVEPEMNWTLISHAIGFIKNYPQYQNSIRNFKFRIYQPRPYHYNGPVREWEISHNQLCDLERQLNEILTNPKEVCNTGSQCKYCPSFALCPAAQISVANAIDVSRQAYNSEIDDENLSKQLDEIARAESVLKQASLAYQDVAMHRLKKGGTLPNYSIAKSYGRTTWNDGMDVDRIKLLTGIDCSKKVLITPNQAKKAGVHKSVIDSLTNRPFTGSKLVREDKTSKAEKLFK